MSNRIVPNTPEPRRRLPLRRCSFRFIGRPESVKAARRWLEHKLTLSDAPPSTVEDALLLLSELATNNIQHVPDRTAKPGDFYVRVFLFQRRLRVEIGDAHRRRPVFQLLSPDATDEGGRGLVLVNALASSWGRFQSVLGPGMFFELCWEAPAPVIPLQREGR